MMRSTSSTVQAEEDTDEGVGARQQREERGWEGGVLREKEVRECWLGWTDTAFEQGTAGQHTTPTRPETSKTQQIKGDCTLGCHACRQQAGATRHIQQQLTGPHLDLQPASTLRSQVKAPNTDTWLTMAAAGYSSPQLIFNYHIM